MMHLIKFRGKRVDDGEWVEGYYCPCCFGYFPCRPAIVPKQEMEQGAWTPKEIIPETVGQYTGLKDRNGTKIFEGDIVKRQWGDYPFQYQLYFVKFSFGKFELEAINTKGTRYIPYHYECEVIGNIYDNSELLF